jgi:hypothetical protein
MDDSHRSYVHADEEERKRYNSAFIKKLIVKDRRIIRVAWEEPFATLSLGEGSSKTRYMELAGLEPATSWVRFG